MYFLKLHDGSFYSYVSLSLSSDTKVAGFETWIKIVEHNIHFCYIDCYPVQWAAIDPCNDVSGVSTRTTNNLAVFFSHSIQCRVSRSNNEVTTSFPAKVSLNVILGLDQMISVLSSKSRSGWMHYSNTQQKKLIKHSYQKTFRPRK